MDFIETQFPRPPQLGYTSSPRYVVEIEEDAGGRETRNRAWSRPLHDFAFEASAATVDLGAIIEFFHAVGGPAIGFRFKDWNDYTSRRVGQAITPYDQPLVQLTSTTYQLTKQYQVGAATQLREIRKPVAATIVLGRNGAPLLTGWTLNAATGVVTFDVAPTGTLTWGGQFDVPVRFDSETLPIELDLLGDDGTYVQRTRFTLREIRV